MTVSTTRFLRILGLPLSSWRAISLVGSLARDGNGWAGVMSFESLPS